MSKQIDVVRVNRTGALIRLHDGNQGLLSQAGMTGTKATVDEKTGRLKEVDGADHTAMIAASSNLVRIGDALVGNMAQRQTLLTSALKLAGGEGYLISLGVYKGGEDSQYIDPNTLHANNAGLPESPVNVGIQDVTAELNAERAKRDTPSKRSAKKKSEAKSEPEAEVAAESDDLSDL